MGCSARGRQAEAEVRDGETSHVALEEGSELYVVPTVYRGVEARRMATGERDGRRTPPTSLLALPHLLSVSHTCLDNARAGNSDTFSR